jgi:hypothetical protein
MRRAATASVLAASALVLAGCAQDGTEAPAPQDTPVGTIATGDAGESPEVGGTE